MFVPKEVTYMYAENDNLPKKGWLHSCIFCDIVTGNTYVFSIGYIIRYDVEAYICRNCCKSKKNIRKLIQLAPRFINNKWKYSF